MASQTSVQRLVVRLPGKGFTQVNVHVPYEGKLPQTEPLPPVDEMADHPDELSGKDAPIARYYRSRRISQTAAKALAGLGYNNVLEVDGGFNNWKAAGSDLLDEGRKGMPSSQPIDQAETDKTRARYNRIARVYDRMEMFAERRFAPMRRKLWALIPGGNVLEVGVGTGKNLPYHPPEAHVTGIDLSEGMLEQARRRAEETGHSIELRQMDAQQLDFADHSFDAAVATFVFCSVPNPVQGLHELARVVKPEGKIVLLEHVRIDHPGIFGKLMDLLDPLVLRIMGPHINRRTSETVRLAGLEVEQVEELAPLGLVKLIVARPENGSHTISTRDTREQDAKEGDE